MGAWGYGILQNDTAQDGLVEVIHRVKDGILRLARRRPAEEVAARAAAGVGMMLHLSAGYWFSPENEERTALLDALRRQEPEFDNLPRGAGRILRQVLDGKGPELANRDGKMGGRLQRALFARNLDGFPMERVFGKREPSLFKHPEGAGFVQEIADYCAARVDKDFRQTFVVEDLSREAESMGAFAVLLVLEPCHIDPARFENWRDRYRKARAGMAEEGFEEEDYYGQYDRCLEVAFQVGIRRFSKK